MEPAPPPDDAFIEIETMTIDQFAGSMALIISSIGALLTIIWQSRCLCKCRIGLGDQCYLFDCSREPPPPDEEQAQRKKEKKEKSINEPKKAKPTVSSDETLVPPKEPEPEPEPSDAELSSLM